MGLESIFSPDAAEEPETVEATPPAPEPIDTPPVEEQPEPVEPRPEPIVPAEEKTVPLAALLDIRDERNELKRRIAEFEAQQAKAPAPKQADPYDDPEGFRVQIQREFEQQRVQDRLDFSYQLASDKHGAEKVEEAREWALERARTHPGFGIELDAQKHPMEWIVQQHAKSQDFAAFETDRVAFARRILEEAGQATGTVAAPAVAQAPAVVAEPAPSPPRSLASSPGKGGLKQEPVGSAVESVFGR